MGVVYYQHKSEKDICSMPMPHAFISMSELKQLIMMLAVLCPHAFISMPELKQLIMTRALGMVVGEPGAMPQRILSSPMPTLAKVRLTSNSLTLLDYFNSVCTAERMLL